MRRPLHNIQRPLSSPSRDQRLQKHVQEQPTDSIPQQHTQSPTHEYVDFAGSPIRRSVGVMILVLFRMSKMALGILRRHSRTCSRGAPPTTSLLQELLLSGTLGGSPLCNGMIWKHHLLHRNLNGTTRSSDGGVSIETARSEIRCSAPLAIWMDDCSSGPAVDTW